MKYCKLQVYKAFSLLLLMFAFQTVQAQECANPGSTMLWQVESAAHPFYLFGSIHVGKPEFYPLPAEIEELFATVENLVFEVNPTLLANPMTVLQLQQRGMYSSGETLADNISAATLDQLKEVLADNGIPIEVVISMKPWLTTTIVTSLELLKLGYMPDYGIESYIMTRKSPDASILELEGLEKQMTYLESLNSERYLAYTLDSLGEDGQVMLQEMISAWRCADHEHLENVLLSEFEDPDMDEELQVEMEALQELMFFSRNKNMAEGIDQLIDAGTGTYLVVIGSGHLLGEGSVIDLLEQAGHKVISVQAQ